MRRRWIAGLGALLAAALLAGSCARKEAVLRDVAEAPVPTRAAAPAPAAEGRPAAGAAAPGVAAPPERWESGASNAAPTVRPEFDRMGAAAASAAPVREMKAEAAPGPEATSPQKAKKAKKAKKAARAETAPMAPMAPGAAPPGAANGFALQYQRRSCDVCGYDRGTSPSGGSTSGSTAMRMKSSPYPGPGDAPSGPAYPGFGEPFDEVWVIQRPAADARPRPGSDDPRGGELRAILPGQAREVPLPLEHTEVRAAVNGYIASVRVAQAYRNPYDSKIEAVYVFPLPENAAVADFVMTIGERRIRGIVREKEEAQRVYREARNQGYVASLLTQERPNVFTQKVANIEPGKRIDVELRYFNTLPYADGEYVFAYPMVVGPRYNPAGTTDGVGAVGRGARGASGQATEVQYLAPGERSGHDISVTVDLEAGVPLEAVRSASHAIAVERTAESRATVRLAAGDTVPNRDFVLSWRVAGKRVKSGFLAERDPDGHGYFTLMLQPPAELSDLPRTAREMVFLVDVSGSMSGWPIEKAKAAIRRALRSLEPDDALQVVTFANGFSTFAPAPVPATAANVAGALAFVDSLRGGGGTEMIRGIRGALDFPHDPGRLRVVSFFTDGYVGNEDQVLAAVAETLGPSRIFSFGVGTAVNRYLIEGLARVGRGAVAYIGAGDSDVEAVDRFFERVAHPALTDVEIGWEGLSVSGVYPRRLPDLFVGRPVILVGRFEGRGQGVVTISGTAGGERRTLRLPVSLDAPEGRREGISKVWARARIAELSDRLATGGDAGAADGIRATALRHGLLSDYTAFVAVDGTRRTEGSGGTTVAVPVPVPEGVRYETTVIGN